MLIRYGFNIEVTLDFPTEIITLLDVHPDRRPQIERETDLRTSQSIQSEIFIDALGNRSRKIAAQPGRLVLALDGVVRDSGVPDVQAHDAECCAIADLPPEALPFLMPSRYCETELLSDFSWTNFGAIIGGWAKVEAVCNFVHNHLKFSYPDARPTRTAVEAFKERSGVCRDFTHLAITLCRALNIPARYCNGYLGDIGIPPDPAPMDFNAWFEVYLQGRWYTFDARHNMARIGRILISRGRDAADTAMITTFGPHKLERFEVTTEEFVEDDALMAAE